MRKTIGERLDAIIEYRDSAWWIVLLVMGPAIVLSAGLTTVLYLLS